MANDLNRVVLIGRLVRDIEVSYTQSGSAVGKFSLAVDSRYKKGGEYVDETSYFDCVLWGNPAESLKGYLVKGKQISIVGRLKQDRWEKDGQKFSKVGISVENIQLLGGRSDGNNAPSQGNVIAPDGASVKGDIVLDADGIPF